MKKLITFTMMVILALLISGACQSQSLLERAASKARQKLEQKAEQKVEEKAEEKIDEVIEKQARENEVTDQSRKAPEGESSEQRDQRRMQGILKGIGISGEPVPVEESYSFTAKIQMHLETKDKNNKITSQGEFITYMNPDQVNFAYEILSGDLNNKGKGIFIVDMKNKATLFLSEEEGAKKGIVYGLDFSLEGNALQEEAANTDQEVRNIESINPNIKKTGRTKQIAGYPCEEYVYNDPENEGEIRYWLTDNLNLKTNNYLGSALKSSLWTAGAASGFLMESEAVNKKTGEISLMQVTEVNTSTGKKITMADYQITNLGNITMPANK